MRSGFDYFDNWSLKKGDRQFFSGTVPFSPFVKKDRDCPSSPEKVACPLFFKRLF
jgi:hypothetical protein